MIARFAASFLIVLTAAAPAAAQEAPGGYILLLDKDGHPLAGSYRIGPGVKLALESASGGLPREPVYLDRAFFPTREAEMLSFHNGLHAYSADPATVDVGGQARIVDRETLLPPLFKDQKPERATALTLTVLARTVLAVGDRTLVGKTYRIEGDGQDSRLGEHVHVEALDIVLPAAAAGAIAAVESGTALSSGDFQALYVERTGTTPDFARCLAEKRKTQAYKALAERQRDTVDAFMAAGFAAGKAFWADKALYEANYAMSVYTLCPP